MKKYLVIINNQYYPSAGTGDWRGPFETEEEAQELVDQFKNDESLFCKIVNLEHWMNPTLWWKDSGC